MTSTASFTILLKSVQGTGDFTCNSLTVLMMSNRSWVRLIWTGLVVHLLFKFPDGISNVSL